MSNSYTGIATVRRKDVQAKNNEGMAMSRKTEKPGNLRADVMPNDGYVLSVDGKLKARFQTSEEAMTAGLKLKQSYPVVQVAIFDATARSYTPVVLPE